MSRPRGVALAMAAAVLVTAPWWGPRSLRPLRFFGVRRVEVVGARYLAPEAVAGALGLGSRASIFEDLRLLERRVGALGGIAGVHVGRRLPGTLRVEVREELPVALAEGPTGLVAVGADARPLPYDVTAAPVDAPLLERIGGPAVRVLATIQATDLGLYAEISAVRSRGGEVVLELNGWGGRVLLAPPMDAAVVRSVSAVRRDLAARSLPWLELDARYRGWVIVRRRAGQVGGGAA